MNAPTTTSPPPRWVVVLVTLVITGGLIYCSSRGDYRSMIVLAVVLLFILGADLGAMLRIWRGGPEQAPPAGPKDGDAS